MARFSDGYFDQFDDQHEAYEELIESYYDPNAAYHQVNADWSDETPASFERNADGEFVDPVVEEHFDWAVVLLEANEFDSFFTWMEMSYEDMQEFWEDFREMYG